MRRGTVRVKMVISGWWMRNGSASGKEMIAKENGDGV